MKTKTKLYIALALIVLLITGFVLNNFNSPSNGEANTPSLPQQTQTDNSWLDKFYIGAIDADYDNVNNYNNLHNLGFNLWHTYMYLEKSTNQNKWFPQMNWGWRYTDDKLMNPYSTYQAKSNQFIDAIYNNGERELLMMRPKIEWLCHGQRSDYKCNDDIDDPELWFYHFQQQGHTTGQNITDNSQFGNNTKVRYCKYNTDGKGLVVSRLKANTEQSHKMDPSEGNQWFGDSECDWLIKPRIRIPVNFPNTNPETPVCSVKVISRDGTTIKTNSVIKAKYFLNSQGQYNGNYIEDYNFGSESNTLTFTGETGNGWVYCARGDHNPDKSGDSHADIQVYWYGNCDMWIDYVRVDNDVANRLLKPGGDSEFDKWIYDDVTQIGYGKIMKYYLELVEFNNIPCMAYVNSKLKQHSGGKADLMQDLHNWLFYHVPLEKAYTVSNAVFLNNQYIQKVGFTQVFAECYPLNGCPNDLSFSKIPITLPVTKGNKIIGEPVTPSQYDTWLQDNLNHRPYSYSDEHNDLKCNTEKGNSVNQELGHFRYKMQLCDSLSKLANIPFIYMAQAHQWYNPWEVRREPTNEELQMMANVAVSYGVKGMLYYSFSSFEGANFGANYGTGLIMPIINNIVQLRNSNYYSQTNPNKIETIQSITNRLINKWGQYLVNFNNADRHSYIYNDNNERNNLLSDTYFSDIITYKPGSGNPVNCANDNPGGDLPAGLTYDCNNDRYIQVATFQTSGSDANKYFMIVNRRCSPYVNESSEVKRGGKRNIRIKFDANSSEFANSNNWEIIDLESNITAAIFDKRTSSIIDLGWYMPGEGKLYKIVPVM